MAENFERLETGQIEMMHGQTHERQSEADNCDTLRQQHDSLAAELVKRGIPHDTEMICPESELGHAAPNYRHGFTDDICNHCAFGQLYPFCNLYKAEYTSGYTCDSFRYYEIMELEPPHGFLMANRKQTAVAGCKKLDHEKAYLIISNGEAFGVAIFEEPAQIKTKEFDAAEWRDQHRITSRERRQWWPDKEMFYIYRVKEWYPFEGVKLYEDGKVIDEPRLTVAQWKIISAAKQLPKQIIIESDFIELTDNYNALCGDKGFYNREAKAVFDATFDRSVNHTSSCDGEETIPLYSLALVRNPRMRVSKKNTTAEGGIEAEKQEGEDMPFGIELREDEYCVINTDTDESMGCHETEEEAEAQLAALRINVETEEGEGAVHTDKPRKRKPKKPHKKETVLRASDNFGIGVTPSAEIKISSPGFLERLKMAAKNIIDIITLAETKETESRKTEMELFMNEAGIAQKMVNGELWHFTYSTNAFEDREGEIFSTKALERYVAQNEINEDKGRFNLWHINADNGNFNTDFAEKQWQGVTSRFLLEAGPYLKDRKGHAAREFFKKFGDRHPDIAPEGWGCSPEFKYLPEERITGTYENIWITRTSTLPKMAAANIWTETRQLERSKNMALSDQQKKAAVEIFGEDFVATMLQEAQDKTAELEAAGVAHKGETETETESPKLESQTQEIQLNMEELAAEVGKQFQADLTPIGEALVTMASDLKEMQSRLEKLEETKRVKDRTETPRYVFNLQRASEQDETIVAEGDDLKNQKPRETEAKINDAWAQVFNK
jgi:hypothetical protein